MDQETSDYYNYEGAYTEWQQVIEGDGYYEKFVAWKPEVQSAAGVNFMTFQPLQYNS